MINMKIKMNFHPLKVFSRFEKYIIFSFYSILSTLLINIYIKQNYNIIFYLNITVILINFINRYIL